MSAKNVASLVLQSSRQFSRSSSAQSANVADGYKTLKNVQAKYQKPDGKPVFLKGGATDQILFITTSVLSVVGCVGIGKLIYELSYPPKNEE
ncbi:cytochrome c oxidase subunit 7A, mitochondrial [Uranotaenia lowii]|uniref:cytochrome c oxidase subunit 7A, mitochondrial n=1 Tax=Uranotaenia lowii TaxID=190385 RepID=UPI0024789659|nr:cytochrome c oxidase subunit 7A, mitochondrial [Uranotaenia lowii]